MVSVKQNYIKVSSELNLFDIFLFLKKFITHFQNEGNFSKVETVLYNVLINLKIQNYDFITFFNTIIFKLRPFIGIRVTKFYRRKILYPVLLSKDRSFFLLFNWLKESVKSRVEFKLEDRILNELIDIFNNKGLTLKKKELFNSQIFENKPYLWRRYFNYKKVLENDNKMNQGNIAKKNKNTKKFLYNKFNYSQLLFLDKKIYNKKKKKL